MTGILRGAMSKKALNKANLIKLGADGLADLVLELVEGSAALQRQARMALSAAQGPKEVAADIRKRFASLRRSTSFISWRQQRAFSKDLFSLLIQIEANVAQDDADEAFELLWSFLQLAQSIYMRTDDSNGTVGDVMHFAMTALGKVAPRVTHDPKHLAERVLDAIADAGYGEFDGVIPATAKALGQEGLEHLKAITEDWVAKPPTAQELERYQGYGFQRSPEEAVRDSKLRTRSIIIADVADAQGDVDAYMARYTAEQLTYGTIAPDVAKRLLAAGRAEEALRIVEASRAAERAEQRVFYNHRLDKAYEECLTQLGHDEELKQNLWSRFEESLSDDALRKYLKLLPDFEDIEAEERALSYAEQFPRVSTAARFLVDWPDLDRAARVIYAQADQLDGDQYYWMSDAADKLCEKQPMAAVLLWRALISDSLAGAKSKRYRYAAKHLASCAQAEVTITDHQGQQSHAEFVAQLRQQHGRKHGFWGLVHQ